MQTNGRKRPAPLVRIFHHISARRRLQFWALLGLTLISSLAEVVSLSSVVPFIGILTQPEKVFSAPYIAQFVATYGFKTASDLVLPLTVLFAATAIFAGGVRLLLLWVSIRLANSTGADLSTEVYRRTLYQPYQVHVARSSSEVISGITQKVATATSVLTSLVTVITSMALFLAILVTLIAIDPMVASVALIGFGCSYALIAWATRLRLRSNSRTIADQQTNVVKALQEGLGAIRDVLLDGSQLIYTGIYKKSIQKLQRATGENQYINTAPRYVMESLGMVLIGLFAYSMSKQPGGMGAAMPTLAAIALGAQRLLPLLQQLYGNWTFVAGSHASLEDVVKFLEQPLPDDAKQTLTEALSFNHFITFSNVNFRYSDISPWVLRDLTLTIQKGSRVGIIGSTGCGKSTMLDILMCLLQPTCGGILVDGHAISTEQSRAWQETIAHVPQNIYLADATIAENIAFGVPVELIDHGRVRQAASQAQIAKFIEVNPEGYGAIVGERGVRLSGGQRQRIGVARALYKKASVLIFDEATSALDSITEQSVMDALQGLDRNLTILIIAHRLSTLKHCDLVVELAAGKIAAQGSYDCFSKTDSSFQGLVASNV